MSKKMASILIAYGALLAGLGFLLQQIVPVLGKPTNITVFAGGGLCVLWGVAALAGLKGRAWAVLTTSAVLLLMLGELIHGWTTSADGVSSLTVRLIVTAMGLLTMGMLMYLLHGERSPEFYQTGATRQDHPARSQKNESQRGGRSPR